MEVESAVFLFTLATLSLTFAGFAALFMILRQVSGGKLNALDRFLTRTLVGHLFVIIGGALLPPALALYAIPDTWVWKISAAAFTVLMLPLLLTYQHRRVAVTGKRAPAPILVLFLVVDPLSIVAMLGYVFDNFHHAAAAYISALTINFFSYGFAFVIALDVILRDPSDVVTKP
jgi:hypothetical protein